MEMSNFMPPELHIAQQSRRDKLRIQHNINFATSAPPHQPPSSPSALAEHFTDYRSSFHQHQMPPHGGGSGVNNTPMELIPSEILNPGGHQSGPFENLIHPSESDGCGFKPFGSESNWAVRNLVQSQFSSHQFSGQDWGNVGGNELPLLPDFVGHHHHQLNDTNGGLSLSLASNELKPLGFTPSVVDPSIRPGKASSSQDAVGSSGLIYRSVGPLGPFTGYATIMRSSRFLKPAQQLLDEFLIAAGLRPAMKDREEAGSVSGAAGVPSCTSRNAADLSGGSTPNCESSYRSDCHEKKAKLLHMQEEVCRRHKQYHQQMQMAMSAFESVPGISNTTPYVSRSIKTISRHFRRLKNGITDQLNRIKKALGEELPLPTSLPKGDSISLRFDQNFVKVRSGSVGATGYAGHQNHVWRPQRGLPERAVSVLRAWLFDHFLHPYPTDTDKQMLATQTGLSRNQVSNWFINARVRLWKPMVEEIHMLETKGANRSEPNSNISDMPSTVNHRPAAGNQPGCKPVLNPMCLGSSSSMEQTRGEMSTDQLLQKRTRMEARPITASMDGSLVGFLPYHQRQGIEMGGMGAVSLTLGLRHGSETTQQFQHQYQQQGLHFGGRVCNS